MSETSHTRLDPSADAETRAAYARLLEILRPLRRVVVAFSGGIDSALVTRAAVDALGRDNVLAATARTPAVPAADLADAERLAAEIGARHTFVATGEFDDENYLANPTNRCYFCKSELYGQLAPFAQRAGYDGVINGVNTDDLGDYRPGLKAADEHGVRAPLAEGGIDKRLVRLLAAALGLSISDKPASPCLSSRVQYGERITPEKLRRIDAAEQALRAAGFRECRVRHHGDLARIEVPGAELARFADATLRERIHAELHALGYRYVTLDLRGFRSGSMNEVLLGAGLHGRVK